MTTRYEVDGAVEVAEVRALLQHGGFRRPLDDDGRIARMLDNASLRIVVRDDDERLVGFTRVITDYAYYGLVVEVVVAPDLKGHGIGREMLRRVREAVGDQVTLVLVSSVEGDPFYEHLGWERIPRGWRQSRQR